MVQILMTLGVSNLALGRYRFWMAAEDDTHETRDELTQCHLFSQKAIRTV